MNIAVFCCASFYHVLPAQITFLPVCSAQINPLVGSQRILFLPALPTTVISAGFKVPEVMHGASGSVASRPESSMSSSGGPQSRRLAPTTSAAAWMQEPLAAAHS